jgi:hypothetical protein
LIASCPANALALHVTTLFVMLQVPFPQATRRCSCLAMPAHINR